MQKKVRIDMKKLILLLLLLTAILTAAARPGTKNGDPLQKFWDKDFIPALEKKQAEKIIAMTAFPFYVFEGGEKKHIIDQPFFRSIIKVLFSKQYIGKLKSLKIKELPFDGVYYRIGFTPGEATQNFNEIFNTTGCYNYLFKPTDDGKSLIFSGMEINLPCGN